MADFFQSGGDRAASPVPSESGVAGASFGEAVGVGQTSAPGAAGVFRRDDRGVNLKGRAPMKYDPRKYYYDVYRGKKDNLPVETSREDRMSAAEAGATLDRLHKLYELDKENEGVIRAFDKGLFFGHTINGASTLVPGRSTFSVPGHTVSFQFGEIRDILGVDQRRFFRAYADDIRDVNAEVMRDFDPNNPMAAEQWGWLMQVAAERGMHRHPTLSHDSADACIYLSPGERAALSASKSLVVSTSNNSVDRMRANNRVASADNYDSTVGEVTPRG